MNSKLAQLIEQIVTEELEDLDEQNALAAGGVSATSTGGALSAAEKKHKDKSCNGTRHDLLWAGDEPLSEQYREPSGGGDKTIESKIASSDSLTKTFNSIKMATGFFEKLSNNPRDLFSSENLGKKFSLVDLLKTMTTNGIMLGDMRSYDIHNLAPLGFRELFGKEANQIRDDLDELENLGLLSFNISVNFGDGEPLFDGSWFEFKNRILNSSIKKKWFWTRAQMKLNKTRKHNSHFEFTEAVTEIIVLKPKFFQLNGIERSR